jgi:hypothetical protein
LNARAMWIIPSTTIWSVLFIFISNAFQYHERWSIIHLRIQ